jgi:hypothetical protein
MNRPAFLSLPAGRLARAAPLAAGLALAATVIPAGIARAAPAGCTTSGTTVTCTYTGVGTYSFPVPSGVTSLDVTAVGAAGGASAKSTNALGQEDFSAGGPGASVEDTAVPVSAYQGQTLTVIVGGPGGDGTLNGPAGAGGSPGGGGSGGAAADIPAGGGGGHSGLLDQSGTTTTALVIAAAGGGGAFENAPAGVLTGGAGDTGGGGGAGGGAGTSDNTQIACGGGGGTSTTGGEGGAGGAAGPTPGSQPGVKGGDGASLAGGPGGPTPADAQDNPGGGGGGGGGYYGGGGGGSGDFGGGGGGGSSFGITGLTNEMTATTAASVTISYTSSNTVTVTNPGNQTSTVGTAVSLQIQATDSAGGQTLTYSATGLPAGLSISSSSGLISGTPTTAGTSSITVTATDTTGASGSASFTWTVTPAPLEVTTTSLPGATLGSAYSATLAATGGTPPYSWSVTSGSLPPGLSLSSSGTISGTPAEAGMYSLTIQAADSSSPRQTATAQLSITVGGCTTSITGSHTGQIVVGKGQFVCIGPNASQNGAITVNSGGGLSMVSSTLTGGISTGGAVSLGLSGSTINGSVSLTNDNGPSVVSGNTIVGSLSCSGNNPPPVDNGRANKVSGKSSGQCSALG